MRFLPVFKWLRRNKLGAGKGRASARPRARFRPQLQPLEDRCLLSTVAGSLIPAGFTGSAIFVEFSSPLISSHSAGTGSSQSSLDGQFTVLDVTAAQNGSAIVSVTSEAFTFATFAGVNQGAQTTEPFQLVITNWLAEPSTVSALSEFGSASNSVGAAISLQKINQSFTSATQLDSVGFITLGSGTTGSGTKAALESALAHASPTLLDGSLVSFLQQFLGDANAQGSSTVLVTVFLAPQVSSSAAGTQAPGSPAAYLLLLVVPQGEEQSSAEPVEFVLLPVTAGELAALASWWNQTAYFEFGPGEFYGPFIEDGPAIWNLTDGEAGPPSEPAKPPVLPTSLSSWWSLTVHPEPGPADVGGPSKPAKPTLPTGLTAAPAAFQIGVQQSNAPAGAVGLEALSGLPASPGLAAVARAMEVGFVLEDRVAGALQGTIPPGSSEEAEAARGETRFGWSETALASNSPVTAGEEKKQTLVALQALAHGVLAAEGAAVAAPSKRDKTRGLKIVAAWAAAQSLWHVCTTFSARRPEPLDAKSAKRP